MSKILIFLAILLAIYIVFFKMKKRGDKEAQNFVECAKCGTFVDMKETVLSSGRYICKECIKDERCS
ncbi:PP0621 family protein [Campylobacter curvus]|uniref:PP0621 family protein n=1 Tax=Campylobacter curvus TaxID=200 RepID=UPI00037A2C1A|nr:PP0621 family protein [Campylobacter curvus]QKF61649.1 hypothetical protein CCVT_1386 [Campylobacter curvus]UEB49950.1 hypothetical protein LK426_00350 [Campylobacter curvus]